MLRGKEIIYTMLIQVEIPFDWEGENVGIAPL